MIRVLLVDDHDLVLLGLRTILEDEPDIRVAGTAANGEEAIALAERLAPDVILMDIRLPGQSGIDAARAISAKGSRPAIVMLTSHGDDALILEAIQAGAVGYLLKDTGYQEVLRAVRAAASGQGLIDPSITLRVLSRLRQDHEVAEAQLFAALSARERAVLALVAEGRDNGEIAQSLSLSEKTVRNYISGILDTLGVANRIEAANYARQHHIERYL